MLNVDSSAWRSVSETMWQQQSNESSHWQQTSLVTQRHLQRAAGWIHCVHVEEISTDPWSQHSEQDIIRQLLTRSQLAVVTTKHTAGDRRTAGERRITSAASLDHRTANRLIRVLRDGTRPAQVHTEDWSLSDFWRSSWQIQTETDMDVMLLSVITEQQTPDSSSLLQTHFYFSG